jgi:hypothetical protein
MSALAISAGASTQEEEFELKDKYMFPIRKAFAEYNSKSEECEKNENKKPPLQASDINFLTQRQAQVMMLREQHHRLSACIYLEENIVIRKHLEVLNLFRSENIFPEDVKALVEALDLYVGLQGSFDRNIQKDYELIPENLRTQFDRVVKGKSLEVDAFEITDSLPQ